MTRTELLARLDLVAQAPGYRPGWSQWAQSWRESIPEAEARGEWHLRACVDEDAAMLEAVGVPVDPKVEDWGMCEVRLVRWTPDDTQAVQP